MSVNKSPKNKSQYRLSKEAKTLLVKLTVKENRKSQNNMIETLIFREAERQGLKP